MPENNRFRSEMLARLPFSSNIIDTIARLNPKYATFGELTAKKSERLLDQSVVYSQPHMSRGKNAPLGGIFQNPNFYLN